MNGFQLIGNKAVWIGAAAAIALVGLPGSANAAHRQVSFGMGIGVNRAGVWVPPTYETVVRNVTVPPVYEDQVRRVWREPVYEQRRFPVQHPAEVVHRRVPRYDRFGRLVGFDTVEQIVRPARTEWRTERVQVRAGYFESVVERVMVQPATIRIVYEQVLTRPGYWAPPGRETVRKSSDPRYAFSVGIRR